MSTSKKTSNPSLKITDLKPTKTAKGGSKVGKTTTNTVTGKSHGTH